MRRSALLGELLTEAGAVTPAALSRALEQQRHTGERLGEVVISLGLAAPEEVATALARQLGLEFVRPSDLLLPREVLALVPEDLARRHRVVPIRRDHHGLVLGMVDPLDVIAIDDVRRATGLAVRPAVITADDFFRALGQYGTPASSVERILGELSAAPAVVEEESVESLRLVAEQAPVVRLVDQVIRQAVRRHASDIHIEPQEDRLRIRYRVDGVLYAVMSPPRHVHAALISRIKIMARLNIAERRLPQDGRLAMRIDDREIDVRVSTIPTIWGE
ncbi:MAG: ATPase, T2SS/T4P/T4SS family, partial [Armatimonadota bacterium]|nr:ATPase, T2SS/T4P/T4SS family [Armatimonadota bacterium]